MRSRLIGFVAALLAVGLSGTPAFASSPHEFQSPRHYYLALGDSLAFGYQQARFDAEFPNVDPSTFNTGYVDGVASRLREIKEAIRTVNLGCPGETTVSFSVRCAYQESGLRLHTSYRGSSQLSTALVFLAAHPGKVSPITIDLGANDLNDLVGTCGVNLGCLSLGFPPVLNQVAINLNGILAALRAAAPRSEIIVVNSYNPYAALDSATNQLAVPFNAAIAAAAAAHGARLADVFTPFNLAAVEPGTLCTLTLFCTAHDVHASGQGYAVMAQQVWASSSYAERDEEEGGQGDQGGERASD